MNKYYAEYDEDTGNYAICTPDGGVLCYVMEEEKEALLSHLNRFEE